MAVRSSSARGAASRRLGEAKLIATWRAVSHAAATVASSAGPSYKRPSPAPGAAAHA